ncbi:C-terminal helicase domain-containing protein [Microbacterium sp. NRRL B-14842]|uniref:AAA domain-containing protein n=1 Tax=Microbacterium sp. NRRL B-14842 TaxID=3162881 RepID=UPI003D2A1207
MPGSSPPPPVPSGARSRASTRASTWCRCATAATRPSRRRKQRRSCASSATLVGRAFHDNDAAGTVRPLTPEDIIVVAPYNAQRQLVHDALAAAGFGGVPVGTVDNFQGKEAVVSITTLAASSGRDAPRGPEFLLLQNRLNVAISRAQVVAYLIHSPALLDDLPYTPEGVARLSAFARLVGAAEEEGS